MRNSANNPADRGEPFTRLLIANQRRIYGFILSLVHSRVDADDLMQEVCAVLWRKFDSYQEGTDFTSWAMRVARLSIYEYRRTKAKLPLPLDKNEFDLLADEAMSLNDEFESRLDALHLCMDQLSERHRKLLSLRYVEGEPVREIAEKLGHSAQAIYKALNKLHASLLDCIRLRLRLKPTGGRRS